VRSPERYGRKLTPDGAFSLSPSSPVRSPALFPVMPDSQLSESVADRMTPIWCQVSGSAWQNVCTALSGLGRYEPLAANSTPDVPSEAKAWPGFTVPMPQADAALSPAPPATGMPGFTPQLDARSA